MRECTRLFVTAAFIGFDQPYSGISTVAVVVKLSVLLTRASNLKEPPPLREKWPHALSAIKFTRHPVAGFPE